MKLSLVINLCADSIPTVWCSTRILRMSSAGELIETVIKGAVYQSNLWSDLQLRVSPRVATCLGAQMTESSSGVSLRTSTTSTAPLNTSPRGRRHLK